MAVQFPGHLSASGQSCQFGGAGGHVNLQAVNVNTGAASAVLTLYNGTSTSGDVVATINAAAVVCFQYEGLRIPNGLFCNLTGGNADVTITVDVC